MVGSRVSGIKTSQAFELSITVPLMARRHLGAGLHIFFADRLEQVSRAGSPSDYAENASWLVQRAWSQMLSNAAVATAARMQLNP